ncbi:MAG: hypothetical protein ACON4U_01920 [Myxococcota bacterium]
MNLLSLMACAPTKSPLADTASQTQQDTVPAQVDTATTPDTGSIPIDGNLQDIGLCVPTGVSDNIDVGPFTDVETESPFGVGSQSNVVLGPITQPDLIEYAPQPGSVDYTIDLGTVTYDLYIPPDYDGTEPYGLVGFINSGNNGGIKSDWQSVLDSEKLIWVGPKDAGNAVNVDVRMGKAIMGMWRMLELFHIDRSRFYVTGNSGGARTAQVLSWLHPRSITGAFPLCGASYFRETTQEFETHEPDSHYEFWGAYFYPNIGGTPFSEWILDYPRPTALLTSSDDFRQGDILNVFHHGLQVDNLPTRYLEVGGNHCATDTAQADAAIGFMDHPFFNVLTDPFTSNSLSESETGLGWIDASPEGGSVHSANGMVLTPTESAPALAIAKNQFFWNDRHGLLLDARLALSSANTTLSFWATDLTIELDAIREGQLTGHPGIHIDLSRDQLYVYATGIGGGIQPLFRGSFNATNGPIDLQMQLWSGGVQLDIGKKLSPAGNELIPLGPDEELLLWRWTDMPSTWVSNAWADDVPVTFTALSRGTETTTIEAIKMQDGVGYICD